MKFNLIIVHPDSLCEFHFDSINLKSAKRKVNSIIKRKNIFNSVEFKRWTKKVGMTSKSKGIGKYRIVRDSVCSNDIRLFLKWTEQLNQ